MSSGEGGGVITCSIYVVWILDERLSSKWALLISNLVFYAQSTITVMSGRSKWALTISNLVFYDQSTVTVISGRSKWALSASQWQPYNSTNLCFWVDPLRSSRLRIWMSDCSFTQRVLNTHRRNITALSICFMSGPTWNCCRLGARSIAQRTTHVCLDVTCHLHFWHNDHGPLRAIVVERIPKLRKVLVCLLCNFCIFNNCSLSFKIYNMYYCVLWCIVYCDVVNIQPRFHFCDEIIK